jgi:uncharacterized protein (TIGR00369 family)
VDTPERTPAPARTRVVEWQDPRAALDLRYRMNGLEYLQGVVDGRIPAPPIARLMDIRLVEVERGRAVFEMTPDESHYNPLGMVHGGVAATILDSAMGCSLHSWLEPDDRYTTIEMKVNYLKAMTTATGRVRGIGTIVHVGRTTALSEGRLVGEDDTLYAHATSTLLIKRAAPR